MHIVFLSLQVNIILAKSYHPNKRGGKAHGGGGNRSDSNTQSSSRGSASRGRGNSRGRGAHTNANTTPQNSKRTDRLPDLGKKQYLSFRNTTSISSC